MELFLFWTRPKLFIFPPPPPLPVWVPAVHCSTNKSTGRKRCYDPAESTSCEAKMIAISLTGKQHHGPLEVEALSEDDWMLFFHRISKFVGKMCSLILTWPESCSGKWQGGHGAKSPSPLFLQMHVSKFNPCSKLCGRQESMWAWRWSLTNSPGLWAGLNCSCWLPQLPVWSSL